MMRIMATWETTSSVVFWDSNGTLTTQNTVISKITDEKSAENTLVANEAIKVTRGSNVLVCPYGAHGCY